MTTRTALVDGAMLCAKVARTGHGFAYWWEPSGRRVPSPGAPAD